MICAKQRVPVKSLNASSLDRLTCERGDTRAKIERRSVGLVIMMLSLIRDRKFWRGNMMMLKICIEMRDDLMRRMTGNMFATNRKY